MPDALPTLHAFRAALYACFTRRAAALFDLIDALLCQVLLWTALRPRTSEQADRWTWLLLAASTQLRLARALVADRRLPWERLLDPARLTPVRVRRGFCHLLPALGTPAPAPKPCGRSPGRLKGRRSGPAPRHPAIKKAA